VALEDVGLASFWRENLKQREGRVDLCVEILECRRVLENIRKEQSQLHSISNAALHGEMLRNKVEWLPPFSRLPLQGFSERVLIYRDSFAKIHIHPTFPDAPGSLSLSRIIV
jgi:hypothetical protein